jgi:hypothetical protein
MKQKASLLFAVLLGVLMYSCAVQAAKPLPFNGVVNKQSTVSGKDVFYQMYNKPSTDKGRIAFFSESEKLLGINEEEMKAAVDAGRIKVTAVGNRTIWTAGLLPNGDISYWRKGKPDELMAEFETREGVLIPWFFLRCANPLRPDGPLLIPTTPHTLETTPPADDLFEGEVENRPCGTWQGAPVVKTTTYVQRYDFYPLRFGTYLNIIETEVTFWPTESITDEHYNIPQEERP